MPSETNGTLQPPPAADVSTLPDNTMNTLELVPATAEEAHACILINSQSWSGPLTPEAYVRREKHLAATSLARNGGLTSWVLIDSADKNSPRTILSACETLRKKAIVARRDGEIKDVVTHGIGSVFCRDEYRGRGYAGRMMGELGRVLERWQQNGGTSTFNVLYSDIGKKFYAKNGWKPFPSLHISLPSCKSGDREQELPDTVPIHDEDIDRLCQQDEDMLRESVSNFKQDGPNTRVALIPDAETLRWHHAREEFVAQEVLQRHPKVKGAYTKTNNGKKVWCMWTRIFSKKEDENTFYILRLAIEGEDDFGVVSSGPESNGTSNGQSPHQDRIAAIAACLRAAQVEASRWNMKSVEIWNPSPTVLAAAKNLSSKAEIIDRDEESIASLLWYGKGNVLETVEWVRNEKFGWC